MRQAEIDQDRNHVGPGQRDRAGGNARIQTLDTQHEEDRHAERRGTGDATAEAAADAKRPPSLPKPVQRHQGDRGAGP